MASYYYSPNLHFKDIVIALFTKRAEKKVIEYFKNYTGKNYILLTSSCRSALFLSYKTLNKNGEIITSPLTCQSAIYPILWSDNNPHFIDVSKNTLNIDPELLEMGLNSNVIGVQIIHHGGLSVDIESIIKVCQKQGILVIEDCAQSFGSQNKIYSDGYGSDIECYSLLKNCYGIGGGILATDNFSIFEQARLIQEEFKGFSTLKACLRIIRNYSQTKRSVLIFRFINKGFMKLRGIRYKTKNKIEIKQSYLKRPHILFSKIFAARINKLSELNKERQRKGILFTEKLQAQSIMNNYQGTDLLHASFAKLFIFSDKIDSQEMLNSLNSKGIEAKHLEQKDKAHVQKRFDNGLISLNSFGLEKCTHYFEIHDHLLSLPLREDMDEKEMDRIIDELKNCINK